MPKDWRMCSPRDWPYQWFDVPLVEPASDDRYPSALDLVDPTWGPTDLPAILEYLDQAADLLTPVPEIGCPFCGVGLSAEHWRSDGVWLWPEKLTHFVREHDVWLPNAFVAHIRIRAYQPAAEGPVDWAHLPWPAEAMGSAEAGAPVFPRPWRDRARRWADRLVRLRPR